MVVYILSCMRSLYAECHMLMNKDKVFYAFLKSGRFYKRR